MRQSLSETQAKSLGWEHHVVGEGLGVPPKVLSLKLFNVDVIIQENFLEMNYSIFQTFCSEMRISRTAVASEAKQVFLFLLSTLKDRRPVFYMASKTRIWCFATEHTKTWTSPKSTRALRL